MMTCLRSPTFLVKVSLVLIMVQPLMYIRKVKLRLKSWEPTNLLFGTTERANSKRIQEADAYIQKLAPLKVNLSEDVKRPPLDIVISIVTVNRPRGRYLIQAAARMHELIQMDDCCFRKLLFICNVDDNYERHTDAVYLKQYLNYIDKSGKPNFRLPHVQRKMRVSAPGPKDTRRRKEIEDYLFCLNVSMSLNPSYVFMMEDDIIPHRDLFPVIRSALSREGLSDSHVRGDIQHLKLFSFDHMTDFRDYISQTLRNYSIAVLFGSILTVFAMMTFTRQARHSYEYHLLIFTRGLLLGSLVVLFIGNDFYLEIFRLSPDLYTFDRLQRSSSAALIFRNDMLKGLTNYLMYANSMEGYRGHKDLVIDTYIRSSGLTGHLIKPYLVEHIGVQSSLPAH